MCVKQPAEGENGEHLRREEGICHRHAQLTAAHPVIIILGIGTHFIRQTGVGLFPWLNALITWIPLMYSIIVLLISEVALTAPA